MEVKVLVQGPDTVHHVMVTASEGEDLQHKLSAAMEQGSPVVRLGSGTFRTDRILAVIKQQSFVDPSMRGSW
jgi:hypothetical protein